MAFRPTIGAFIITKNEEEMIASCILALGVLDQILVYDSGSSDRTTEIAAEYGAEVLVDTDWVGFGVQKQRALQRMRTTYVLSIDADEIATPAFREFLASIKDFDADRSEESFTIRRANYFLGKKMRFGYFSPEDIVRLGPRTALRFDGKWTHEKIISDVPIKKLKFTCVEHHSRRSIGQILIKQAAYGAKSFDSTKSPGLGRAIFMHWLGIRTFISAYIIRLGMLDGVAGYLAALSRAQSRFWSGVQR